MTTTVTIKTDPSGLELLQHAVAAYKAMWTWHEKAASDAAVGSLEEELDAAMSTPRSCQRPGAPDLEGRVVINRLEHLETTLGSHT